MPVVIHGCWFRNPYVQFNFCMFTELNCLCLLFTFHKVQNALMLQFLPKTFCETGNSIMFCSLPSLTGRGSSCLHQFVLQSDGKFITFLSSSHTVAPSVRWSSFAFQCMLYTWLQIQVNTEVNFHICYYFMQMFSNFLSSSHGHFLRLIHEENLLFI